MVRIIKGTFIYYDGRFRVPYKAGETLECDPDLERRLVEVDRIAEFVSAEHSTPPPLPMRWRKPQSRWRKTKPSPSRQKKSSTSNP